MNVSRVLDEGTETLFARAQPSVLPGEQLRCTRKGAEQQEQQQQPDGPHDEEDIARCRGNLRVDWRCVLVDLVRTDDLLVGTANRQGRFEQVSGYGTLELILRRTAVGELGRDLAVECLVEILLDIKPLAAQ